MLKPEDLIKMALEETAVNPATEKTPIRKAYDAVTNGAMAVGGAVASGIAGIQSLDKPAPYKQIS
jgi:hypothetical protein